ncbi:hypothetical protein J2Y45_006094 [Dyadobacter sp. BE34]|uniref:HIRAN domain-containing protein n=1 Tax=Dyadobacter fermentans TaxID=94254 RepID=A0ABU1R7G2_9BACT|nr:MULTISPECIES: HIRAN domain-containing protein [Dyadobacter]MDR6808880.1 hypothetical protein [Dyadobacter fermentans]MDR7046623.1 hypothetical protein [Dyadobacter sp. BE242]MDR7200937.1 hypothetical protein [Dyadobacter sp. BE34]MDR7218897.1 hypothetical protein [Dyadobacter sp. BE31]MDR7264893.1 hypothetical protein [Dyadobacter sp. BE32]
MARKAYRSDNSVQAEIKMLADFGFDYADKAGIRYDSKSYRLVREKFNPYDANAIVLYINQVKIGYVERGVAKLIAPQMDEGDVFSARHVHSTKGNHYEEKFDNKYNDGYYRNLTVQIYNESAISRDKGQPLPTEVTNSLSTLLRNPSLSDKHNERDRVGGGGCGCMVLMVALSGLASLILVFTLF